MTEQTTTEWVQIPVSCAGSESAMTGFLARPAGPGPWPSVLLGFEMFGITGYLREVAAQVAAAGYLALVPDFYHWQAPGGAHLELAADETGRSRGYELINGLQRDQVEADVRAAIDYLAKREEAAGTPAMIGLSAGGHIGYYAATRIPLTALAVFYPGWLTNDDVGLSRGEPVLAGTSGLARLGTPVLILAGGDDFLYSPGDIDQIDAELTRDGVEHEVVVYPGTPHGFACFERDTYRPKEAADAWDRTFGLLAKSFGTRGR